MPAPVLAETRTATPGSGSTRRTRAEGRSCSRRAAAASRSGSARASKDRGSSPSTADSTKMHGARACRSPSRSARCRCARPRRSPRAVPPYRSGGSGRLRARWSRARSRASCPGSGVTIATSSPARRLSRLDLPTFGRPTSTTVRPSRSTAPWLRLGQQRRAVLRAHPRSRARLLAAVGRSISSSGKSMQASTCMRSCHERFRRCAWMRRENSPASERAALRAASALAASIRSATLSACARSMRSFRNARRVNSPGSRDARAELARSGAAAAAARRGRRAPAARARPRRCTNAARGRRARGPGR